MRSRCTCVPIPMIATFERIFKKRIIVAQLLTIFPTETCASSWLVAHTQAVDGGQTPGSYLSSRAFHNFSKNEESIVCYMRCLLENPWKGRWFAGSFFPVSSSFNEEEDGMDDGHGEDENSFLHDTIHSD